MSLEARDFESCNGLDMIWLKVCDMTPESFGNDSIPFPGTLDVKPGCNGWADRCEFGPSSAKLKFSETNVVVVELSMSNLICFSCTASVENVVAHVHSKAALGSRF